MASNPKTRWNSLRELRRGGEAAHHAFHIALKFSILTADVHIQGGLKADRTQQ
jgi:hypothetical protein